MSFVASFSITTTSTPDEFVLLDTSVGSDMNLTGRTVGLYQANSELLVALIPWAIADNTITINSLTQDYALDVRVLWISSSPLAPPSTYTYSLLYAFTGFGEAFYYSLTQQQTATPNIIQDQNYYNDKMILRVELDSAVQAIDVGGDIYSAQNCITRYQFLINNSQYLF